MGATVIARAMGGPESTSDALSPALKRNALASFICNDMEVVMLHEVNQAQKDNTAWLSEIKNYRSHRI